MENENQPTNEIKFIPNKIDMLLAIIAAFIMPIICGWLYDVTGALLSMLIYYGIFCIGIVKWRRGSLEYQIPKKWPIKPFLVLIIIQIVTIWAGLMTVEKSEIYDLTGILFTVLIWAPINASMEQLIWIYSYDAFAMQEVSSKKKPIYIILGLLMITTLVGLIHAFFWSKFLPSSAPLAPYTQIYFTLQIAITFGYIYLYKKGKSMLPIALIHILINVITTIAAEYSILPYLIQ